MRNILFFIFLLVFLLLETFTVQAQQRYAMIICGGYNKGSLSEANSQLYCKLWQKTFLTWEDLTCYQHVAKENVIVLYGNGYDWYDLDPLHENARYKAAMYGLVKITNYPSDTNVLSLLINKWKSKLKTEDALSVYFIVSTPEADSNYISDLIFTYGKLNQEYFITRLKQLRSKVDFQLISTE